MENFKKSTLFGKEIFLSPNGTGGIDEYNIIETVFNAIQKVKGDKKKSFNFKYPIISKYLLFCIEI
jgi:hypothetical protein